MREKPGYYSIIPANIRYDEDLTANEKLMYGEITALASKNGRAWPENNYFAELYGVHKKTVSRWISNLENKGYVKVKLEYRHNSKQVSKRYLYINDTPIRNIVDRYPQKNGEGIHNNVEEELSTTRTNITSTNTSSAELTERFERLWKLYPRKQGKKDALRHYKRAIKEGATDPEIEQGIKAYVREIKITNTKKQFIKHGSAWFNQNSWEDEYLGDSKKERKDEVTTDFDNLGDLLGGNNE